ncbi:MAG: hypothetical protein FWH28_05105, partial [Clostridiales bacterium]|nr:hypothetical protein [Clostridiales bacterium]
PAGWEPIPNMLEDMDTGEVFNWKTTPITKPTNVMLAVNKTAFLVSFYALDGETFVYSQLVSAGDFLDGTDPDLVDTWTDANALWANYQISGNLRVKANWLKDLDTGDEFDWTVTPITSVMNVTLALEDQYNLPPSPVTPGEFYVEHPTLQNLGFEWYVEGDENHNATVEVTYREVGTTEWKTALPLIRILNERGSFNSITYISPNMFTGSIFDLKEDTAYECKFVMSDPDGVIGNDTEIVTVRTRPEPVPALTQAQGGTGRVYHVYPRGTPTSQMQTPNYFNLMSAYYLGSAGGDHSLTFEPRVRAGDTILIHAGTYKDDRFAYSSSTGLGTPFDGTHYLTAKGTAEAPIAIKAAGDGEVIFDGDGNYNLFNVLAADYNYFEGIHIRNTEVAFLAGNKNITGAIGLTVKNCYFEDIGIGVHNEWSGSKDYYIANNMFIGRENYGYLVGWFGGNWNTFPAYPVPLVSYYAVKLTGEGHVMANNYVTYFHDGLDLSTYGVPDGYTAGEVIRDRRPVAIDFYNNYITVMADNFIETDGGLHNIRVMRNYMLNAAERGVSMQPVFAGPVYWIRNVLYHNLFSGVVKFMGDPSGGIWYNNTFCSELSNAGLNSNMHFRNNLILYEQPTARLFNYTTHTNYSSSDYNGFCPAPNQANPFGWTSPPFDRMTSYPPGPTTRTTRNFATLAAYQAATGQDTHSVIVDYGVFMNVPVPAVGDNGRIYTEDEFDFRLKPDSVAVDAGTFLPNVTDDFIGAAPDLGAYEIDQVLPTYGPTWMATMDWWAQ